MQKIRIDYLNSPELQMALMNKEPGEECELTIKLSTISADDESLEGSVEEVTYEYEGEEMTIEPTTEEPVGMDMFSDLEMEDEEEDDEEEIDMAVVIPTGDEAEMDMEEEMMG